MLLMGGGILAFKLDPSGARGSAQDLGIFDAHLDDMAITMVDRGPARIVIQKEYVHGSVTSKFSR